MCSACARRAHSGRPAGLALSSGTRSALTLGPFSAIAPPVTELLMRGLLMALISVDPAGLVAGRRRSLRTTKTSAKKTTATTV